MTEEPTEEAEAPTEEAEAPTTSDPEPVVLIAALSEAAAVQLIEAALPHASHLRPLWERILVGEYDGQMAIGVPITSKVTTDTIENHSRHLYSLLNLLGVPLVTSPMALTIIEIQRSALRPLKGPISHSARKAAAAAAAAAAAEAEAEAETEAEGKGATKSEADDSKS